MAFPEGGVREQTRQSLLNLKAVLDNQALRWILYLKLPVSSQRWRIFRYLMKYTRIFGDSGAPARSCIQAGKLPKEALVGNAVNLLMTILICSHSILVTSG